MSDASDPEADGLLSVRRANLAIAGERAAVTGLLAEYAATLHAPLAADAVEIVERLQADGRSLVWLAWQGERACGFAVCFRLFSTFSGQPTLNIHDLATAGDCRGRGVGTLLVNAIVQEAEALGCGKVTLEVREDNPAAERLYRRLGFGDPDGMPTRFLCRKLDRGAP